MHLDHIGVCCRDRIVKSNGSVGISAGVQNDGLAFPACLLHPAHELALMVRLAEMQGDPNLGAARSKARLNGCECRMAIDFRLPGAEQIEVRTIEHVDGFHDGSARKRWCCVAQTRSKRKQSSPRAAAA